MNRAITVTIIVTIIVVATGCPLTNASAAALASVKASAIAPLSWVPFSLTSFTRRTSPSSTVSANLLCHQDEFAEMGRLSVMMLWTVVSKPGLSFSADSSMLRMEVARSCGFAGSKDMRLAFSAGDVGCEVWRLVKHGKSVAKISSMVDDGSEVMAKI